MTSSRTVDKITSDLDQEEKLMYVHQKNGAYVQAEQSRLKIIQLKKDLEARTLYEMEQRHKRELNDLEKTNNNEIAAYNNQVNQRASDLNQEGAKSQSELLAKHKQEQEDHRKELEGSLSTNVKESSDLLNLRKMEEYMLKQQAYGQAHKVQQQIFEKEKIEKQGWMDKRNQRIETSLNTLRGKQSVELANLRKRYKTLLDELFTQQKIEEDRLMKKHENFVKDLKSQQEKQLLNYKGEFRSKGGKDSPLRLKSTFTT